MEKTKMNEDDVAAEWSLTSFLIGEKHLLVLFKDYWEKGICDNPQNFPAFMTREEWAEQLDAFIAANGSHFRKGD